MSKFSSFLSLSKHGDLPPLDELARALNQPRQVLLSHLDQAWVTNNTVSDLAVASDKAKLSAWLAGEHRSSMFPQKRVPLDGDLHIHELLRAVAEGENGSYWDVLQLFSFKVLWGEAIEPGMQQVVNLVWARLFLTGAVHERRKGRPKDQRMVALGREVAAQYLDMRDAGASYASAVSQIATIVNKDERHVMRLVEEYKSDFGATFADRQEMRGLNEGLTWLDEQMHVAMDPPDDPDDQANLVGVRFPRAIDALLRELTVEDLVEHIDALIASSVSQLKPLTKKN